MFGYLEVCSLTAAGLGLGDPVNHHLKRTYHKSRKFYLSARFEDNYC